MKIFTKKQNFINKVSDFHKEINLSFFKEKDNTEYFAKMVSKMHQGSVVIKMSNNLNEKELITKKIALKLYKT